MKSAGEKRVLSDEQLMVQLAGDDMDALNEIYHRHVSMVKGALVRFSSGGVSVADLEELVQEVFLALIKSARYFSGDKRLKPWLYGISVQKARNHRRNSWFRRHLLRQHHGRAVAVAKPKACSPDQATALREDVKRVFENLPKRQLEVLLLHAVEGFSGAEIAEILDIREGTVWSRLHRAREALQTLFPEGIELLQPAIGGDL